MRLIEDNGELIEQLPDSTALLIVRSGHKPYALIERIRGKAAITDQSQLVSAIVDYLNVPGNIDHIIATSLPRKKAAHRHN